MTQRKFKGVWIPAEIWLHPHLTPQDKIVQAEYESTGDINIQSLAKFCKSDTNSILDSIRKLKSLNLLSRATESTQPDKLVDRDINSLHNAIFEQITHNSAVDNLKVFAELDKTSKNAVTEICVQNSKRLVKNILALNSKSTKGDQILKSLVETKLTALFSQFYDTYPRHIGKAQAKATYIKKFGDTPYSEIGKRHNTIMTHLQDRLDELQERDKQFVPYPSSWLNQEF